MNIDYNIEQFTPIGEKQIGDPELGPVFSFDVTYKAAYKVDSWSHGINIGRIENKKVVEIYNKQSSDRIMKLRHL